MVVTYGRRCPNGYLPAYSVNTEAEARELIQRACEPVFLTSEGRFGHVAQELVEDQTLENLQAFGRRLAEVYKGMLKENKR